LQLEALEERFLPTTFTVFSEANSGPFTLREAIALANGTPGTNAIHFDIGGAGAHTIKLSSALPLITHPVVIDATTQPGYAGSPLITLDGSGSGINDGLWIVAGNSTVKGLAVGGFASSGIRLDGSGGNWIAGNRLGTDATGTKALSNNYGLFVIGSTNNTVGGPAAGSGNLVSGNTTSGIEVYTGSGTVIQGNRVGTDAAGAKALPNSVGLSIGGFNNSIGGTAAGAGNLVSGNNSYGVELWGGGNDVLQGNRIGTDATGTQALPNDTGVDATSYNTLGGTAAGAGNLISGNKNDGILLAGAGTSGSHNLIQGNRIGTDVTGTKALPNYDGVYVTQSFNTIGGTAAGAGNTISGNAHVGVVLSGLPVGGVGNVIQGNRIGTDASGAYALGNVVGVALTDSKFDTVGGATSGAGNLISGNSVYGIWARNGSTHLIQGNRIGTDATGTKALPNYDGLFLFSTSNLVGGTTAGAGNLISGNKNAGLWLDGDGNVVQGNRIGTDAAGALALPNDTGVAITSSGNTVGGTAAGAGNTVSGNTHDGVSVSGGGSGNVVQGNRIGTDTAGALALPNDTGVALYAGSTANTVGGAASGAGNLLSGNTLYGASVVGSGNAVQGNLVGTDAAGAAALPNFIGVRITGAGNTVGGTAAGAGNTISGNLNAGVKVDAPPGGGGNAVQGNRIGTDATGAKAVPNAYGVFIFNGSGNLVGGTDPGAGNLISGNAFYGVLVEDPGNAVQGNRVGTDAAGAYALPNATGVRVAFGGNNTVGGTDPGAGNLISGNASYGVSVGTNSNLIQGNLVGTDAAGANPLPNATGVYVSGSNNAVGGEDPGAGNTIAFNLGDGVQVDGGSGNAILANAVFGNGGLGIDLLNGGNNGQPAALLSSATQAGGVTTLSGSLLGAAFSSYTLELFASDPNDPNQGQVFLGSVTVSTDGTGVASFSMGLVLGIAPGQYLTATATDPLGNTSAFSVGVLVS
jgi:titin